MILIFAKIGACGVRVQEILQENKNDITIKNSRREEDPKRPVQFKAARAEQLDRILVMK